MQKITSQTTDEELMSLYLQAYSPAFDELYSRHSGKLLGYLKKKVSPELAEELLQDVFVRMHSAKHSFKPNYLFLPWIFTVARNALFDYYKRAETRVSTQTEALPEDLTADTSDTAFDTEALLRELTPQQKRIFELRYLKEWSFEKIAEDTQLSPSNVRQIISRGIKFLKTKASES